MPEGEITFSVHECPEGGYEARAIGYAIFTQADSLDELKAMVKDAMVCHFDDESRPHTIRLRIVRDEFITARSCRETSAGRTSPGC